ncbi:MAG: hypothetical protein IKI54_05945 [Lachnospiraceae bacterium]|nr:hypothetical protein [Lachnospiraceae bacterium]
MAEKSKAYYEEDLQGITDCTEEEMQDLALRIRAGEKEARDRFVEGNLRRVYEAAAFFETEKIQFMDLVQEGNLKLLMLMSDLPERGAYGALLNREINSALEDYVTQEEDSDRAKEELKVRLNVIDEVCVRLAEEYGREATAEEVAEKMKMDPEDVRYLMKIALSAIKRD